MAVKANPVPESTPSPKKFPVAVVGCSAGGVQALSAFFSQIPSDLEAAFVVVSHLPANGESHLTEILSREVACRVGCTRGSTRAG
jgi:chemotaxis response regulator CheB